MIDIKKLTDKNVKRKVVLHNRHDGRIVSWSDRSIYVRYDEPRAHWNSKFKPEETNHKTGLRTVPKFLEFKYSEIVTRADLIDFDED